ncbi:MAG: hypothetical protein ACRELY_23120, partial [Polyangiaceae bacterium]
MKFIGRRNAKLALFALIFTVFAIGVFRAVPIKAAPPHARVSPAQATPLPEMKICWAEFARNEAWGQLGTAGITHAPTWNVTVSGLVVEHPRGNLVIDVGNSSRFHQEIAGYGPFDRAWLEALPGSNRVLKSAPDALRDLGVDPDHLFGILVS